MSVVPMEDVLDHALADRHGAASDILDDLTSGTRPSAATEEHAPSTLRTCVETVRRYGCDRLSGTSTARRHGAHVVENGTEGIRPVVDELGDPGRPPVEVVADRSGANPGERVTLADPSSRPTPPPARAGTSPVPGQVQDRDMGGAA